jgi:hypothetical protein
MPEWTCFNTEIRQDRWDQQCEATHPFAGASPKPRSDEIRVSRGREPAVKLGYGPGTYFTNQTGDILYT